MEENVVQRKTEELYLRLSKTLDLRSQRRAEWRSLSTRQERRHMQQFMLEMADAARVGTKADVLELQKAAYAILPLHGPPLAELAAGLMDMRQVPLEWCDVLVAALAEQEHPNTQAAVDILDALNETLCGTAISKTDQARARVLIRQIGSLGYTNPWLTLPP